MFQIKLYWFQLTAAGLISPLWRVIYSMRNCRQCGARNLKHLKNVRNPMLDVLSCNYHYMLKFYKVSSHYYVIKRLKRAQEHNRQHWKLYNSLHLFNVIRVLIEICMLLPHDFYTSVYITINFSLIKSISFIRKSKTSWKL